VGKPLLEYFCHPSLERKNKEKIACGSRPSLGTLVQPVEERSPSTGKGRQLQAAMAMDKASVHLQIQWTPDIKVKIAGRMEISTSTSMATRGIQGTTTIEL